MHLREAFSFSRSSLPFTSLAFHEGPNELSWSWGKTSVMCHEICKPDLFGGNVCFVPPSFVPYVFPTGGVFSSWEEMSEQWQQGQVKGCGATQHVNPSQHPLSPLIRMMRRHQRLGPSSFLRSKRKKNRGKGGQKELNHPLYLSFDLTSLHSKLFLDPWTSCLPDQKGRGLSGLLSE